MIKSRHIRDKTTELLQDHFDSVNVYNSRIPNVQKVDLPAIAVYTKAETADGREPNSAGFEVTYELAIDIMVKADRTLSLDEDNWANVADEIEDGVFETLFENGDWVSISDGIMGYTIERELTDEGEYDMALTQIVIVLSAYQYYNIR